MDVVKSSFFFDSQKNQEGVGREDDVAERNMKFCKFHEEWIWIEVFSFWGIGR